MNINITLIIPVYNVGKYLIECLESVVKQSVSFFEVILVNDGSTDNSLQICEKYAFKYNYIKLINQENKGLSAARNIGLHYAKSEYVMFLDSDDYLAINAVQKLSEKLHEAEYDAIYFDGAIHCEEGYVVDHNIYDRSNANLDGIRMSGWDYFSKCYPEYYVSSVCFAIYKKEIIDQGMLRFPEGIFYEDNYFSFNVLKRVKKSLHISDKLYQRRYRKNSITTSEHSEKKFVDITKVSLLIWNEIMKEKFILPERKELLLTFVTNYCDMVLDKYCLCKNESIHLSKNSKSLFYNFIDRYEEMVNALYLYNGMISLFTLNKVLDCFDRMYTCCIKKRSSVKKIMEKLVNEKKEFLEEELCKLPLNEEKKIGIYGTGKHTEGLIAFFEKIIGNIRCDLVFIDSYKSNGVYKGKRIINYQEIDEKFELIIVSSFLYEEDMINKIRSISNIVPIYRFYKETRKDMFSGYEIFLENYF